jgi:signal peptidase I
LAKRSSIQDKTDLNSSAAERKQKPKARKETTMEFIASMAEVFVIGLFIVTFNFQPFEIPSASMVSTLLIGDHLFVDRTTPAPPTKWVGPLIPYSDVKRGDIVVFISPVQPGLHVVKRIVGVPGDRLRLRNKQLYVNGQLMDEPYVIQPEGYSSYRDDFPTGLAEYEGNIDRVWRVTMPGNVQNGEIVVPPGRYFGMGDHREVSLDSRYWGFIPRENIIGRPMVIYWSFDTPENQFQKTEMSDRVRWIFHVVLNFFQDTRWKRTLRLVR